MELFTKGIIEKILKKGNIVSYKRLRQKKNISVLGGIIAKNEAFVKYYRFLLFSLILTPLFLFLFCGPEGNRTPFSSMPWRYTTGVLQAHNLCSSSHFAKASRVNGLFRDLPRVAPENIEREERSVDLGGLEPPTSAMRMQCSTR